jgi:hypothetical protein
MELVTNDDNNMTFVNSLTFVLDRKITLSVFEGPLPFLRTAKQNTWKCEEGAIKHPHLTGEGKH